ncbi:Uma2 family endonuclease [Raineya orbicola]|jgi:Uma2 family endonuclease|uniref:Putative restriction endonuclease n=1 Tax=Raineya orbicola TaxID=2016530 RepID=A0A2N3IKM1_9BACT|nr:Uma2 family endonuclease [Raineya orbicola]PKQ70844.1 putative restriction endonuclease [Raineya orbicola]
METLVVEKKPTISKEDFFALQSQTEKVWEYNNGEITEINRMKSSELLVISKLNRKFIQTQVFKDLGELFQEVDCWLTETQMRRPDLAFFTREQILQSAEKQHPIPAFVIEIISENDNVNYTENKVLEYQHAGVQVIWHIYPELKLAKVIRGKEARYYEGSEIFDASPIVPGFQISVEELFAQ